MTRTFGGVLATLLPLIGLSVPIAQAGTVWSFDTIPATGNVAGPPSSTIGWGYTITNPDPSQWLVLTNLSADSFVEASALSLFDFPIVPPGATVAKSFDGVNGLYEITWNAGAPAGTVNTGTFVGSAEWWSSDPLGGGVFLNDAVDESAPYSAAVISAVPEPGSALLFVFGLAALRFIRIRRSG